ncbi:4-hydroxy-tetrahydrodipicolinate reductase [Brevibacillus fluminis]|uniref:4-hydroxy-tetrahydrodipicolinate reductase n=1 Tax=Brevibacillus fluminis TaxID=511487 RepID=UPI003F8B318E
MRIGLMGFGKTGKAVAEELLKDSGSRLEWVLKSSTEHSGNYASEVLGHGPLQGLIHSVQEVDLATFFKKHPVDVMVDFSSADSVHCYASAAHAKVRIVSAISNYSPYQLDVLKHASRSTAILYSPNITIGINFLLEASKFLKTIIPHADIEIVEEHFAAKKDRSGTAVRIADQLGLNEREHIHSVRVGGIVGKHEIIFGLENQTIRLVHESISRNAFGQGALYAAKWLSNKTAGLYTMEEVLGINVGQRRTALKSS